MNSLLLAILITFLMASCIEEHRSDAQTATVHEMTPSVNNKSGDTLRVDLTESKIQWKGTKMRGTRKHEGNVKLLHAYLLTKDGQVTGGNFVVAMKTLRVTDIPSHERVPERNLNNHLKSADFFDVEKYPDAIFKITGVEYLAVDTLKITGNLTIKDVTKSIEFSALNKDKAFSTKFNFDRFQWNITYKGNLVERTLVDKNIELTIDLKIE